MNIYTKGGDKGTTSLSIQKMSPSQMTAFSWWEPLMN